MSDDDDDDDLSHVLTPPLIPACTHPPTYLPTYLPNPSQPHHLGGRRLPVQAAQGGHLGHCHSTCCDIPAVRPLQGAQHCTLTWLLSLYILKHDTSAQPHLVYAWRLRVTAASWVTVAVMLSMGDGGHQLVGCLVGWLVSGIMGR